MTLSWDRIVAIVLASLSSEESKVSVVYLDVQEFPAGTVIEIDGTEVRVPWLSRIAFVDLQPTANWGHACRYLFLNPETGDLQQMLARFPPFLRGVPQTLRVIWKGDDVPDWAVAHAPPAEGEIWT
jgi:hypothetical protein